MIKKRRWYEIISVLAMVALLAPSVRADGEVDLTLDSKPRKYDSKNPLQAEQQQFSLSRPGILTLVHVIDPVHKDSQGGFTLEEANLSNYVIGTGIFQERVPDTAIPGQMRTFKQQWLCGPRKEPLKLRASLVAPHRPQSFQVRNVGEQLGSSQRLIISFVPFEKIAAEPGAKPELDVSGKWYHGEENGIWTLTPKGSGEYEAVEKGYDNAKGTARVKGRKVYIDWVTTTAKDGKQKHGVTVVEVKTDGTHAEGWSVGDWGTGSERWSAVPGTTSKPFIPSASTASTGLTGVGPGIVAPVKWEYRIFDLPAGQVFGDQFQKKLTELGDEGWEVASILSMPIPKDNSSLTFRIILKRSGHR